jgi:hypothetical protein
MADEEALKAAAIRNAAAGGGLLDALASAPPAPATIAPPFGQGMPTAPPPVPAPLPPEGPPLPPEMLEQAKAIPTAKQRANSASMLEQAKGIALPSERLQQNPSAPLEPVVKPSQTPEEFAASQDTKTAQAVSPDILRGIQIKQLLDRAEAAAQRQRELKAQSRKEADDLIDQPLQVKSLAEHYGWLGSIAMVLAAGLAGFNRDKPNGVLQLMSATNKRFAEDARAGRKAKLQQLQNVANDATAEEIAQQGLINKYTQSLLESMYTYNTKTADSEFLKQKFKEEFALRDESAKAALAQRLLEINLEGQKAGVVERSKLGARADAKAQAASLVPTTGALQRLQRAGITRKDYEAAVNAKIGTGRVSDASATLINLKRAKNAIVAIARENGGNIPSFDPLDPRQVNFIRDFASKMGLGGESADARSIIGQLITDQTRLAGGGNPSDFERKTVAEQIGKTLEQFTAFLDPRIKSLEQARRAAVAAHLPPGIPGGVDLVLNAYDSAQAGADIGGEEEVELH